MLKLCGIDDIPRTFDVSGIYGIEHIQSKRVYIGSSTNVRSRLWKHLRMLRRCEHHSRHLQNAWNKYGSSEFILCLFELVSDRKLLVVREQYWIDFLNAWGAGYNSRPKAESMAGITWTSDQNERRRQSNLQTWASPTLRDELSRRFVGKRRGKWTEESYRKTSSSLKAYHVDNPIARLAFKSKIWDDPIIREKRLNRVRQSLKNPKIYNARVQQLQGAITNPKRLINLREAAFQSKNRSSIGIYSNRGLTEKIVDLYKRGLSLREIGKKVWLDHKAVAARLRVLNIPVNRRYKSGSGHPFAKLNEDDVRKIRALIGKGQTQSSISERFKVSSSIISDIKTKKSWKHVH
jgi:group I intron endonuclease